MAKENIDQHHNEDYEYDTLTNDKIMIMMVSGSLIMICLRGGNGCFILL